MIQRFLNGQRPSWINVICWIMHEKCSAQDFRTIGRHGVYSESVFFQWRRLFENMPRSSSWKGALTKGEKTATLTNLEKYLNVWNVFKDLQRYHARPHSYWNLQTQTAANRLSCPRNWLRKIWQDVLLQFVATWSISPAIKYSQVWWSWIHVRPCFLKLRY